ncbi:DEAD/DEAH box helicase [Patescibacteria group bacterium]|nr:MAG: DEAD/DEAH box helicase [Patescibacteria group bacterium]
MSPSSSVAPSNFDGLGISPKILEALDRLKITSPTPIQKQAIPVAMDGKDVVGIAQTGTGKTFAFGIPMLQILSRTKGQGLVLLPTRELALQVEESIMRLAGRFGLRTAVLIGGASMHRQKEMLRKVPHIIVATPGRLIDHLEQRTLKLDRVNVLVLDEADRMLDMGFAPQINKILRQVPKDRQTMLFSATMPSAIAKIAAEYMKLPVRVEVAPQGTAAERVVQELFVVRKEDKPRLLEHLLREVRGSVLVFTRTKFGAKKLTRILVRAGHAAAEIHSDRSLAQRRGALEGFKSGKHRVLVATDIAARGIDVTGIELVVNFDLPDQAEDYVHRIGRTGRAGHSGRAISFAMPDQGSDVRQIEKLVRVHLPVTPTPGELPAVVVSPENRSDHREEAGRRGYGGGRGGYGGGRSHGGRPQHGGSRGSGRSADQGRAFGGGQRREGGGSPDGRRGGTQAGVRGKHERARKPTDPVENHPDRWQPPASYKRFGKKRPA